MAQRHLLLKAAKNINVAGEPKIGGEVLGHLITDVDPRTLAGMITYRHVTIEDRGDVDDDSLPEGQELSVDEADEAEPDADSSASDAVDEGRDGEAGEGASAPSPAEPDQKVADQDKGVVSQFMAAGIPENTAEALAEASRHDDVPDRDLLVTLDGVRQWVAKGHDLVELPKIGMIRKAEIEKIL